MCHPRFGFGLADRHELVGGAIGEGAQQQGANAAEDRRVDADAEREAKDTRRS